MQSLAGRGIGGIWSPFWICFLSTHRRGLQGHIPTRGFLSHMQLFRNLHVVFFLSLNNEGYCSVGVAVEQRRERGTDEECVCVGGSESQRRPKESVWLTQRDVT